MTESQGRYLYSLKQTVTQTEVGFLTTRKNRERNRGRFWNRFQNRLQKRGRFQTKQPKRPRKSRNIDEYRPKLGIPRKNSGLLIKTENRTEDGSRTGYRNRGRNQGRFLTLNQEPRTEPEPKNWNRLGVHVTHDL